MPSQQLTVDVDLRWGDMDAYRHVNNVQFVRLLEEARVRGFRTWFHGTSHGHMPTMLVARCEIDYLHQLKYRTEPVHIAMWVSDLAGASFNVDYEVADGDLVYARAQTTLVLFDLEQDRPRRIDPETRAALQPFVGEPVRLKRHGRRG